MINAEVFDCIASSGFSADIQGMAAGFDDRRVFAGFFCQSKDFAAYSFILKAENSFFFFVGKAPDGGQVHFFKAVCTEQGYDFIGCGVVSFLKAGGGIVDELACPEYMAQIFPVHLMRCKANIDSLFTPYILATSSNLRCKSNG